MFQKYCILQSLINSTFNTVLTEDEVLRGLKILSLSFIYIFFYMSAVSRTVDSRNVKKTLPVGRVKIHFISGLRDKLNFTFDIW